MKTIKKQKEIHFRNNFRIYWNSLKNYKPLLYTCIIITLILEGIALLDNYFLKVIIDNGTSYSSSLISQNEYINIILIIAVAFVLASILKTILKWAAIHLLNRLDGFTMADLKQKLFNHLVNLSHRFHNNHKPGSLISRLDRGSSAMENMNDFIIFYTLPLIFQFILVTVALAYFDWVSAVIVVITILLFVLYSFYLQNVQQSANIKLNQVEDLEKGIIGDTFTNIDSIKYFGKESNIKGKYSRLSDNTRDAMIKLWDYFRWISAGQGLILAVGTFILLFFSIKRFLSGDISIGTIVFIYTSYGNIFDMLYNFVYGVKGFYYSMANFETLFKYYKIKNEIKNKPNAKDLIIRQGGIEFKNVYFEFKTRKIFTNFNLKINKNEKIAIVGHSGSGKTTLIKLLYRFYDVTRGEILIDGKDIKDYKQESLRSELSIVPQECVLFNDTIYNNILFSRSDATKKEVLEAIKFAQMDKILNRFPLREYTLVGERGAKLSGGERQRISIARAILADKKILILDEATSALDSQTESEIQKCFEELLENRTSIIIAHRLSTIMKADRIVVLEKGRIVQIGKHSELIKQEGLYHKLWSLQKGGYIS